MAENAGAKRFYHILGDVLVLAVIGLATHFQMLDPTWKWCADLVSLIAFFDLVWQLF
jgi:hypothetical protein